MDRSYSVIIERPADEVFAYVTDPANIPSWASYIETVELQPPGPLTVGSQIRQTVRGRAAVWTVMDYRPNDLCVYEADYWYATVRVSYVVEALGSRTRFTIHDRGYRKGYMRLVGPLLDLIDAYYRRVQMRIIKETLEGGAAGVADA